MKIAPFIYKETLHVLRDRRMLLVVLLIPIVLMLLFGFAISTEINEVNVAVAWQQHGEAERRAIERLQANPYTRFVGTIDQTDIAPTLRAAKADAVVVFNSHGNMQVVVDASNPNIAQSATVYISAIVSGQAAPDLLQTHMLYNPRLRSSYNFVPGIMGMLFLLICSLMTAVAIVREKETGTMELLLVSPVRPIAIIVSKMTPFFLISCIDLAIIIVIAKYVLGVPMSAGLWPVLTFSLVYILLALAMGLFVSALASSQLMAMLFCGMVMIFPVVMLSGMIYPIDNLPIILKQLSAVVPARWYIDAMRKLMVEGLPFRMVLDDFAILCAMTLLLMTVAVKKFKIRLQ